jgi:hypothetical protein
VQRTEGGAGLYGTVCRPRRGAGSVAVESDNGVECRVEALDALQAEFQRICRSKPARRDVGSEVDG